MDVGRETRRLHVGPISNAGRYIYLLPAGRVPGSPEIVPHPNYGVVYLIL